MKGRIVRPLILCWMQDALLVTHNHTASHCNVSGSAISVTVGPCCQVSKSKSSRKTFHCIVQVLECELCNIQSKR
jgi:hypothetical protein